MDNLRRLGGLGFRKIIIRKKIENQSVLKWNCNGVEEKRKLIGSLGALNKSWILNESGCLLI